MPSDEIFYKIWSFILNPEFEGFFFYFKIILIFVSLVFFFGTIVLLFRATWLKRYLTEDLTESFTARPYGAPKTLKEWAKIQKRLETGKEDELKLALIEAETLLDEALKNAGFAGENIAERLKQTDVNVLPNLEQVLQAHKIRNSIVFDADYKLSPETAKAALEIYRQALTNLKEF